MPDVDKQKDQQSAQEDADKKVNVPQNVTAAQTLGYDPQKYTSRSDRHQEVLKRFGLSSYAVFEEQLGTVFARAVVAYLLGDADHARVVGNALITDELPPVPGGVKADSSEADEPDDTYKSGKTEVRVKNNQYFVNGYRFAEKRHADLYAKAQDNPTPASGDIVAKPMDGAEKTALGADGEIGVADPIAQAQKDKDLSRVQEQQDKQNNAVKK